MTTGAFDKSSKWTNNNTSTNNNSSNNNNADHTHNTFFESPVPFSSGSGLEIPAGTPKQKFPRVNLAMMRSEHVSRQHRLGAMKQLDDRRGRGGGMATHMDQKMPEIIKTERFIHGFWYFPCNLFYWICNTTIKYENIK